MKFGKHIKIILKKMCEMAGVKFEDIDFSDKLWFTKHLWSVEKEEEFTKWLADYFYKSKGAREEIMEIPVKNKNHCRKASENFVFFYGWRYKKGRWENGAYL